MKHIDDWKRLNFKASEMNQLKLLFFAITLFSSFQIQGQCKPVFRRMMNMSLKLKIDNSSSRFDSKINLPLFHSTSIHSRLNETSIKRTIETGSLQTEVENISLKALMDTLLSQMQMSNYH